MREARLFAVCAARDVADKREVGVIRHIVFAALVKVGHYAGSELFRLFF